jgi:uncharacterized protein with HEPN domain
MQPSTREFIEHIRDESTFCLLQLADKSYEDFINDTVLTRAVVRSLEIIGEASKNIPADVRNKYPAVEWRVMAGMRDRLIHHYFGIDYETIYKTIKEDLPILEEWTNKFLGENSE